MFNSTPADWIREFHANNRLYMTHWLSSFSRPVSGHGHYVPKVLSSHVDTNSPKGTPIVQVVCVSHRNCISAELPIVLSPWLLEEHSQELMDGHNNASPSF